MIITWTSLKLVGDGRTDQPLGRKKDKPTNIVRYRAVIAVKTVMEKYHFNQIKSLKTGTLTTKYNIYMTRQIPNQPWSEAKVKIVSH